MADMLCQRRHLHQQLQQIMSAIARLAVSPRLSMAAARSLRPASVQATQWLSTSTNNSSKSCLPSPASPSPPASPWPPPAACAPPPCRPPSGSPPPPPSLTLTLLPSSLEPALPPSESPGPEPELAPCSAP